MKLIYAFPEPLPLPRARGLQVVHTVAALARAGIDVTLYHVPVRGRDPFVEYCVDRPPNTRLIPVSRGLFPGLDRPHSNQLFLRRFVRLAGADIERAIVMVRHPRIGSMLLDRMPNVRLLYEAHEVFADTAPRHKAELRRHEEAQVVRGASALVCNSAATAVRLAELYAPGRQMEVIPNGVDRPDVVPQKDWSHAGQNIVYVGSFFSWKGAADLVAAAAELPGLRITVVGGEPERVGELKASVDARGAEVLVSGRESHAAALARLATACIAVLPNRNEPDSTFTSPIKLFEYMAHGCAVVASDLPPIREVLSEDEAQWAVAGDPHSLAAAIRRLVEEPQRARALAERGRDKSLRYTWSARAERLKAVLEKLAGAS